MNWHFPAMLAVITAASGALGTAMAATHRVPAIHAAIADGLGAAAAGDTVLVAAGTYLEHDLVLRSGVTLLGATGNPDDVVIDGERLGRCLYGAGLDASTRVEAVTLTNGLPAWGTTPNNSWGGGMMVDEGALTILNCVFRTNETAVGGAIFLRGTGSPLVADCLFDRNEATEDAGLLVTGICDPTIRNCTFTGGNRTMVGGGLGITISGAALVEDCTIENNTVWETGGGLEVFGRSCRVTLRNCLVRGNTARLGGGGIYVGNYGQLTLEHCTVTGNSCDDTGGGVFLGFDAGLTGTQVSILGNSAPSGPDGYAGASATALLTCCEVDLAAWLAPGQLTLNNEGCGVGTEKATWGKVKSLFR